MGLGKRPLAVLLLLLALGGSARAAPTVEPRVERKAVEALLGELGDQGQPSDEQLDALRDVPDADPWITVEHLLARGRRDIAMRLAAQTSLDELGPLDIYAARAADPAVVQEQLRVLDAGRAALAEGLDEQAVRMLAPFGAADARKSVFGVMGLTLRGNTVAQIPRLGEAIDLWLHAADDALRIGWWAAAGRLIGTATQSAMNVNDFARLERAMGMLSVLREVQGDELGVATTIHDLGAIASWRGALPRAARRFTDALARYEQLGRTDDAAEVIGQRSRVLVELGDFAASLADEEWLRRYLAGRPHDVAWAELQLDVGIVRLRLGDAEGARAVFAEAAAVLREHEETASLIVAEGNLGLAISMAGRSEEALVLLRSTLERVGRTRDRLSYATACNNLAETLGQLGEQAMAAAASLPDASARKAARTKARARLMEAETLANRAVAKANAIGADQVACAARKTLADIHAAGGRYESALPLYAQVRAEAARMLAWHLELSALQSLVRVRRLAGDPAGAVAHARVAAERLLTSFGGLAEADVARARQLVPDVFDLGLLAARDADRPLDVAYFLEAGRAMALLRGLGGRTGALRAAVPHALQVELAAATARKLEAYRVWQRSDRRRLVKEAREHWAAYEAARAQEDALLERVRAFKARVGKTLAPDSPVSLADIVRRLRAGRQTGQRQVFLLCNVQAETICIMKVGEDEKARILYVPPAETVELRAAFRRIAEARNGALDAADLAIVKRLFLERLGIPVGPVRLIVCPDRELAYVPLSVLVPDDWEVVWAPSATTYEMLGEGNVRRGRGVLAVGDPVYGAPARVDVLAKRGGPKLVRLPGTRTEIEAIATGPRDRALLGEEASEAGLRAALAAAGPKHRWQSVHLACHGLIDLEVPTLSSLALTAGKDEDGLLTSTEVLGLELRTDLAVLSACQTGRGAYVRGEGIMSLTRAFMHAGAPRVLVSLWNVDDEATAFLMQHFYREWRAGRSTAQALRRAQIAVREHEVSVPAKTPGGEPTVERPWADPRFWGAWTLWGLPD